MRVQRAALFLFLVACGGRVESQTPTGDASTTNDTVPCGDAGACAASTTFCKILDLDGGVTYACTALPTSCHACECAAPPTVGEICSCTSDGDQIVASCQSF